MLSQGRLWLTISLFGVTNTLDGAGNSDMQLSRIANAVPHSAAPRHFTKAMEETVMSSDVGEWNRSWGTRRPTLTVAVRKSSSALDQTEDHAAECGTAEAFSAAHKAKKAHYLTVRAAKERAMADARFEWFEERSQGPSRVSEVSLTGPFWLRWLIHRILPRPRLIQLSLPH